MQKATSNIFYAELWRLLFENAGVVLFGSLLMISFTANVLLVGTMRLDDTGFFALPFLQMTTFAGFVVCWNQNLFRQRGNRTQTEALTYYMVLPVKRVNIFAAEIMILSAAIGILQVATYLPFFLFSGGKIPWSFWLQPLTDTIELFFLIALSTYTLIIHFRSDQDFNWRQILSSIFRLGPWTLYIYLSDSHRMEAALSSASTPWWVLPAHIWLPFLILASIGLLWTAAKKFERVDIG